MSSNEVILQNVISLLICCLSLTAICRTYLLFDNLSKSSELFRNIPKICERVLKLCELSAFSVKLSCL